MHQIFQSPDSPSNGIICADLEAIRPRSHTTRSGWLGQSEEHRPCKKTGSEGCIQRGRAKTTADCASGQYRDLGRVQTGTLKFADGRRQECFNSPYGATHFPAYAETIGYKPGEPYDPARSESDTVKMLSSIAKETGTWLVGGTHPTFHVTIVERSEHGEQELYPRERSPRATCTTPLPYTRRKVRVLHPSAWLMPLTNNRRVGGSISQNPSV